MARTDIILLHAPSVYDFRERVIMHGPISDVIPSTCIFEMYPLGFVSMLGNLEESGFHGRIVNLGVKMLRDQNFDVTSFINHLDTEAFGVDLHWLVHAQGSLELAKIIKRLHPDKPVILGGLSATYYHKQILADYPYVDYVLRGDSVEKPLLDLLQRLEKKRSVEDIPNLSWRDRSGRIYDNPLTYIPENLDDYLLNYEYVAKTVLRHRDLQSSLPFNDWTDYPYTAVISCKGCLYNCITCGGSQSTYKNFFGRKRPVFMQPKMLVEQLRIIENYIKGPIFILGDLRLGGSKYVEEVLTSIKREGIDNPLVFELFTADTNGYLDKVAKSCSNFALEISPESHDEDVRRLQGRDYKNIELEKTVENAFRRGCMKLDIFFMIGLPGQTKNSVNETVKYCDRLLEKYGNDKKLYPFIAPLAPFLDPGSIAFENPENYGYKLFFNSLEESRKSLMAPNWKYYLNYKTVWMGRDEIVNASYDSARLLAEVKLKHAIITSEEAVSAKERIELAISITRKIDDILQLESDPKKIRQQLQYLKSEVESVNRDLLCTKEELRVPIKAEINKMSFIKFLLGRR